MTDILRRALLASTMFAVPFAAHAQEVEPEEAVVTGDEVTETIVITGSRIPRPEFTAASPVTAFDREQIEQFSPTLIEDFLNNQPQIVPDLGRSSNNPGNGTASVNLRGLGTDRSLVLLNGRRVGPHGAGSQADVNVIPAIMIERIEVVTGGASAVYGSDAVTGAVNFITRREWSGVEASVQFDIFGAGDGEVYNASIAVGTGFADGRGQVSIFGDFLKREPLLGDDRAISSQVFFEDRVTGTLFEGGSFTTPEGVVFNPPFIIDGAVNFAIFNSDGSVRAFQDGDTYNFAPDNYIQTPLDRWSAGMFANFEASNSTDLFVELGYVKIDTGSLLAPTPGVFFSPFSLNSGFLTPDALAIIAPSVDPDMDGIALALLARRFSEVGDRQIDSDRDNYRATVGLTSRLSRDWSLEAYYSFWRNDAVTSFANDVSRSRLAQALLVDPVTGGCLDPSNGCAPANIFGLGNVSPEAVEFIRLETFSNQERATQHVASLSLTGGFFDLVDVAVGAEYRRNSANFDPDQVIVADSLGFRAADAISGTINLYELYGELLLPLFDNAGFPGRVEIEAGGRFSHYSTSGDVWTWKLGGQWEPVDSLRFKGMVQRAVRAPGVGALFAPRLFELTTFNGSFDFCSASRNPVAAGLGDICVAQGMDASQLGIYEAPPFFPITATNGGNPDLQPEEARTITAGVDYRTRGPINAHFAIDYFDIEIDEAIGALGSPVDLCALSANADSVACRAITRDNTGLLVTVDNSLTNVATLATEGFDLSVALNGDAPGFLGRDTAFSFRSIVSHYFKRGVRDAEGAPFIDCAGFFERVCAFGASTTSPAWTAVTTAGLNGERWQASLRWRWIDGMENLAPLVADLANQPEPVLPIPSIGAESYFDLSLGYRLREGIWLRGGVSNLFENDPPQLAQESNQSGTDPSRYDIYGRRFWISLRAKIF